MLLWIQPKFIFVILAVLTIVFIIIRRYDIQLVRLGIEKNNKEHKISSMLFDYLSNIKTLITLRFQSRTVYELKSKSDSIFPVLRSYAWVQEIKWFFMDILNGFMFIGLIVWYIYNELMQFGTIKLGNLTMILQYMQELRSAFDNITRYRSQILHQATDITAVDSILNEYQQEHASDLHMSFAQRNRKTLRIQHLNFGYKNSEQDHLTLQDISLTLQSGQKIAFV